jgi:hypothetical protein
LPSHDRDLRPFSDSELETVNHETDFTFIVGVTRYSCPSCVAEFLSPWVTSLRAQEITIDEFTIDTDDPNDYFGKASSTLEWDSDWEG